MPNSMNKLVAKFNLLPKPLRRHVISAILGRKVPFVGTAGVAIEEINPQRVVTSLRNKHRVQNHIKTIHAAAATLLAETSSGFVVGMNLPDNKLPLMKSLSVKFKKLNKGDLRVTASLTQEQIKRMHDEPRGDVTVAIEARDSAGQQTIQCKMVWAWIPKKD